MELNRGQAMTSEGIKAMFAEKERELDEQVQIAKHMQAVQIAIATAFSMPKHLLEGDRIDNSTDDAT